MTLNNGTYLQALTIATLLLGLAGCEEASDDADAGPDSGAAGDADTDADADGDGDADTDTTDDILTATVTVPEEFADSPVELDVFYLPSLTESPAGTGITIGSPSIGPGNSVEIEATHAGLEGVYLVAVVLFVDGGGYGGFPMSGIDWIYLPDETVTLGEGPIELGEIELYIYE